MTRPSEPHTVWRHVAAQSGGMPDGDVQRACMDEGFVRAVCVARNDSEWEAAYARLLRHIGRLEAVRQSPGTVLQPRRDGTADPRWALLAELSGRAGWPLYQPTIFRPWLRGGGGHPLPRSNAVEVRFDDRFTQDAAVAMIRKQWPELVRLGIVRSRPRRMKDNTIELLRFVCLQTDVDDSWETRWRAWEARYGKRGTGWGYSTRRAFISDVHRAEQSLVGHSRGLAWFYDPIAREERKALNRRYWAGDTEAAKELLRREQMGSASLKELQGRIDKGVAKRRQRDG
jgi:hypothetical protein